VTRSALAAVLLLAPTLATAAPSYEVVVGGVNGDGIQLARQGVPTPAPTAALALSRVIFLNRHGVTITPGSNDSRVNRSSVTSAPATIPGWDPPAEVWTDTVACLEAMFARFDVELTEIDPGMTPHVEAVFGGSPALLGLPPRVGGVAPLSQTCGVVENAMVYTFTEILVEDSQVVCETMSQEIAHAYGLDHELLASDPMSYLRPEGDRTFQDEMASCGETTPRQCGLGATACRVQQNSYAVLLERLGPSGYVPPDEPADDPTGPSVTPPEEPTEVGCSTTGGGASLLVGLAALLGLRRRRTR
jgi:uncharacterized protein (TIGR03382 family)